MKDKMAVIEDARDFFSVIQIIEFPIREKEKNNPVTASVITLLLETSRKIIDPSHIEIFKYFFKENEKRFKRELLQRIAGLEKCTYFVSLEKMYEEINKILEEKDSNLTELDSTENFRFLSDNFLRFASENLKKKNNWAYEN